MNNNKEVLSMEEKNILEIEKVLITENISVDNYLDYFFKINTACSTGIVKNPLRVYLALRNANVILSANDKDNQIEVYDNVVNTVNYLISNYAKAYINEDTNLEKYSENLQATMLQNDFITFEMFKKCYYLFELYVLAGIKGSNFFEFISLLNEAYVKTEQINEIIDLTNMKTRLSTYIESYKKEHSKKNIK